MTEVSKTGEGMVEERYHRLSITSGKMPYGGFDAIITALGEQGIRPSRIAVDFEEGNFDFQTNGSVEMSRVNNTLNALSENGHEFTYEERTFRRYKKDSRGFCMFETAKS
jgi:hypothetical protein